TKKHDDKTKREAKGKSLAESLTGYRNLSSEFEDFSDNSINEINVAASLVHAVGQISTNSTNTFSAAGTKWVFRNKKDERGIVVRNKARLVTQGHTQEEGIDYKEVFAPVARIEAIRLFLAYASFIGFMVYQMDVKSAFLYGTIEKEKPDGIFISQDKYVAEILRKFGLTYEKSASTPIDTEKPLLKDPDVEGKVGIEVCAVDLKVSAVRLNVTAVSSKFLLFESIDCLSNEEIFTELSRMGYEKPSTKLTFYKAFFSPQWKFLIYTILQCMSAKRMSWNEFSSSMTLAIICLSTSRKFNFSKAQVSDLFSHPTKYSSPALTQKGAASVAVDDVPATADEPSIPSPPPTTQPPPPSQDLPSTSQLKQRVKKLERRNKLKVSKLRRLKKVGTAQRVDTSDDTVMDDVSKQGRIIASMDADVNVTLKDVFDIAKEVDVDDEIEESVDIQKRQAESQAQIYQINLKHANKVLMVTATSATITAATTPLTTAAPTLTTAPSAARRRKGVRKEKEDNDVMMYQALKRKPQTKAQVRKNMMIYMRNIAGFKMDYFKGMKYDDIRPIFENYFNSNVAFLEKTKEQMEEEDSRALKKANEMPNDEDDVYTEATPLARKVLVVDYEIYTENNKPYYKIIRADGSPQLFLSFLSLLRNFDRGDLEVLWQLVKERFASSKPKNFSDDFMLTTLTYMFEKPDVQAQVWKNQRTVHGLANVKSWRLLESRGVHIITFTSTEMILLVERRYPLTRFTLDQMLNNVRLKVEEESEVSLELLRFVRQQQQEGFKPE
nr:copia protein [Tanacetum cinerariifolium]